MARNPTNFWLLDEAKEPWATRIPVTVADAFEGQTNNLNEEGLYSSRIFGRVGTDERDTTESYIDFTLPIFNPVYFRHLVQLKDLYQEILKGKAYAKWDDVNKDFIKSNILEGDTGYAFFMSHFSEIEPRENESFKRTQRIDVVENNRSCSMLTRYPVIPAGLRDIEISPTGFVQENEINDLYRRLIFKSRSLSVKNIDPTDPVFDNIRWGLQESANEISSFIFKRLDGKRGFFQRKVVRRACFGAARNVITARKMSVDDCDNNPLGGVNTTLLPFYQALKEFYLTSAHALMTGYLARIFNPGTSMAKLINSKTWEAEYVEVDNSVVEKWTTSDGLLKLFDGFQNPALRNRQIMLKGHYLALVYDDGESVMLLEDINDLPEGFDKKKVKPATYMEFFYLQTCKAIESKMVQMTRYPITGIGSIYPSRVVVMTTVSGYGSRKMLDESGNHYDTCHTFPTYKASPDYFDGMSVSNTKLDKLGGDHDGDALTANPIQAADSIREIQELFGKREYYIASSGEFFYSPIVEPHAFLLRALTSGLKDE